MNWLHMDYKPIFLCKPQWALFTGRPFLQEPSHTDTHTFVFTTNKNFKTYELTPYGLYTHLFVRTPMSTFYRKTIPSWNITHRLWYLFFYYKQEFLNLINWLHMYYTPIFLCEPQLALVTRRLFLHEPSHTDSHNFFLLQTRILVCSKTKQKRYESLCVMVHEGMVFL